MAAEENKTHLVLQDTSRTEHFSSPRQNRNDLVIPQRDRVEHAASLRSQISQVKTSQQELVNHQKETGLKSTHGIQIEFESFGRVEMAADSLARDKSGIELMNVRNVGDRTFATVFVPDGKLTHFEKLLTAYEAYKKNARGHSADNQPLLDSIKAIRVATFQARWTDSIEALPKNEQEEIWWEAWLPLGKARNDYVQEFIRISRIANLKISERILKFPERTVVLVFGSKEQIVASAVLLNMIAELRRAKNTAAFFDSLIPPEQIEWEEHLSERLNNIVPDIDPVYVTLLDTGVSHGHSLLAPFVSARDLHSVEPDWGVGDSDGHGTEQAGLALLGDLTSALIEDVPLNVQHRLESVKLLQHGGGNKGESYGALTIEAVARAEVTDAYRKRVFSMAVTADDGRDFGRPSSWSSALDRLTSDYEDQGTAPRLFVVSAGNSMDSSSWADHPAVLATNGIQDPAQSWNAVTVGAFSQLTQITEKDGKAYRAIASVDDLSPFTTTSVKWKSDWPFKPDIVMEGGNAGVDEGGFCSTWASLSLLTTYAEPLIRSFTTTHATSAATALATKLAAEIWSAYPRFWPETVRALMIHSARWTSTMLDQYLGKHKSRESLSNLLRHCGYGVPNQARALWSASNSLTLIIEDSLQPYEKMAKGIKSKDMHIHDLPFPSDFLERLGDTQVTMRVTVSYFIEPNPGLRGSADKYAYQSHALRFDVRRPLESENAFKARVNSLARGQDYNLFQPAVEDNGWFIGDLLRRRGSLLSDTWTGTAAELANRGQIAIFPTMGWWRNRPGQERFDRSARYSMIVSIETPEVGIDLYSEVQKVISQSSVLSEIKL